MGEEINTEKTADKVRGKPFQKGDDPRRNIEGRPLGALNFATKFRAFIEKVAENNEMTADEIEQQLLAIGYKRAKEGDYQFWRDLHDRVYGKPLMSIEHTEIDARKQRVPTEVEKKAAKAYRKVLEEHEQK
jgi:hypothetical protein